MERGVRGVHGVVVYAVWKCMDVGVYRCRVYGYAAGR